MKKHKNLYIDNVVISKKKNAFAFIKANKTDINWGFYAVYKYLNTKEE